MNVQVTVSAFSRRASASWTDDGARFHVWFDIDTKELDSERKIYKNPPDGVDSKHPDYFRTRYLDGELPKNAEIIKRVLAEVDRRNLIAAALAVEEEKLRQRKAENDEHIRVEKIKASALRLLAEVRAVAEGATRTEHCQALLRELGEL